MTRNNLPNEGLSCNLTSVNDLFVYHIHGQPKGISRWVEHPDTFQLQVAGLVKHSLKLTLDDIRNNFTSVSQIAILQCMTGVHWGRVCMEGPTLLEVLRSAGVDKDAKKVAFTGGEGFTTDLELEWIRDHADSFLLAYKMNHKPLTREHGYPVRLTARGKYGYKWCKWLTKIEVLGYDYKGYYENVRGWSDQADRGQPVTPNA